MGIKCLTTADIPAHRITQAPQILLGTTFHYNFLRIGIGSGRTIRLDSSLQSNHHSNTDLMMAMAQVDLALAQVDSGLARVALGLAQVGLVLEET